MNFSNKKNLIMILGIGAGFTLLLFFGSSFRILRLQIRAGRILDEFLITNGIETNDQFTCLLPLVENLSDVDRLQEAITLLENATSIDPDHPQTHLLLGKVYCLSGDFPKAIEAFKVYSQVKPANPLGTMELAFAMFASQITTSSSYPGVGLADELVTLFQSVNISSEDFSAHAHDAFRKENFQTAWLWYGVTDEMAALDNLSAYRKAILDLLFQQSDKAARALLSDNIFIGSTSKVFIPPTGYFRLDNGDQVPTGEKLGREAAILYSKYEDARVFIEINHSGCYQISVPILDTPPSPILIDVTVDFKPIMEIQLENGDDAWRVFGGQLFLEEGYHLIGFRLENDTKFDGLDRNAMIGSLTIYPCEN